MRRLFLAALLLACLACTPVSSVVTQSEKVPPGAGITLLVLGPDGPGVEHEVLKILQESGYKVFSPSLISLAYATPVEGTLGSRDLETELLRKYPSPFLCRIKGTAYGPSASMFHSFTLQIINTESGRVILSLRGQNGHYSGEDIAQALRAALTGMR